MVPTTKEEHEPSSREARFEQLKEKCARIAHYLRCGKHVPGLSKNIQRTVRSQAKSYNWNESSKLIVFNINWLH